MPDSIDKINQDPFREVYEARKAEIEESDEELIKKSLEGGRAFRDSTQFHFIERVLETIFDRNTITWDRTRGKLKDVLEKMRTADLVNIGCGTEGMHHGWQLLDNINLDKLENKVISIDPFIKEDEFYEASVEGLGEDEAKEMKNEIKENTQDFRQVDGLGFLLDQADGTLNSLTASINSSLIPSDDYLKRLAQEIFRVTPENGVYVSLDSLDLEKEAEQLFPYKKEDANILYFSKTPFDDEIEE